MLPYVLPALPRVVPQDGATPAWYAAARMLASWRRRRCATPVPDPDETRACRLRGFRVVPTEGIPLVARALGLRPVPHASPRPNPVLLEQWLRHCGPIWTDAIRVDRSGVAADPGHIVVLAGVDATPTAPRVYVLDPWPEGHGHEGWRPYNQMLSLIAANDEPRRAPNFLYRP